MNTYQDVSTNNYNLFLENQCLKEDITLLRSKIEKYCSILHSHLETIESCGGGSARCMMAEIFLPINL